MKNHENASSLDLFHLQKMDFAASQRGLPGCVMLSFPPVPKMLIKWSVAISGGLVDGISQNG